MLLNFWKLSDRWIDYPTRKLIFKFKNTVVDVAIDKASIVNKLKSGNVIIANHDTIETERTVETILVRIQKLAIFQEYIYVEDLGNDRFWYVHYSFLSDLFIWSRFYNLGSSSVCLFPRKTYHQLPGLAFHQPDHH